MYSVSSMHCDDNNDDCDERLLLLLSFLPALPGEKWTEKNSHTAKHFKIGVYLSSALQVIQYVCKVCTACACQKLDICRFDVPSVMANFVTVIYLVFGDIFRLNWCKNVIKLMFSRSRNATIDKWYTKKTKKYIFVYAKINDLLLFRRLSWALRSSRSFSPLFRASYMCVYYLMGILIFRVKRVLARKHSVKWSWITVHLMPGIHSINLNVKWFSVAFLKSIKKNLRFLLYIFLFEKKIK